MNTPLQFQQTLRQLGFSNNEIKILIFLFHTKKATAQAISFQTGVSFSSTQYCLSNLLSLEIIHSLPNEENYFEIVSQSDFCEWIEKARKENQLIYEKSKNEIQRFLFSIDGGLKKIGIEHYNGRNEVIKIYEDILRSEKKYIYSWLDIKNMHEKLGKSYLMDFINRRMNKDVKVQAIMPINEKNLEHESRDEKRDAKFVKKFLVDKEIRIYNEKVAIIDFKQKEPSGVVLREGMINQSFRNFFLNTWEYIKGDHPSFYQKQL